jgi:hypothetical protein
MKAYFKHQLKNNSRAIIVITVLMTLIAVFTAFDSMDYERCMWFVEENGEYYTANGNMLRDPTEYYLNGKSVPITDQKLLQVKYRDLTLSTPMTMLIILSLAVPVWMFAFLKKKRNLDCLYSLPITKRGVGIVQFAVGGITVLVPFVVSYAATLICYASYGSFATLGHNYLIGHFAISLLMGFVLYSISVFVFEKANTVIDGIIFIAVYMVGLLLLLYAADEIIRNVCDIRNALVWAEKVKSGGVGTEHYDSHVLGYWRHLSIYQDYGVPAYYFGELLSSYEYCAMTVYHDMVSNAWADNGTVFWMIFWSIAGIASAAGAIYTFGTKKTESAEEISNSLFGYKLIIPILSFSLILAGGVLDGEFATALLITVAAAVGYTVYRRGVRYKKSDYIIVGIMLVLAIVSVFFENFLERQMNELYNSMRYIE